MSSVEDHEDRLAAIQEGRQAVALMGLIKPFVDQQLEIRIQNMAGLFRAGQATPDKLLGIAAQVALLLDLLSTLGSKAVRGDIAANKEMGNGRTR